MITHLGTLSIFGMCPALVAAQAAYAQARLKALAELNAKLAGLAKLSAALSLQIPAVEIAAKIEGAAAVAASIALNVTKPGASLQLAAVLAAIDAIELQIAALIELPAIDTGGFDAYAYAGKCSAFGGELSTALGAGLPSGGGPAHPIDALVIASGNPIAWSALSAVLKTS